MFTKKQTKIGRSIRFSFGVVLATMLATAAFASKNLVQDRRVSMAKAQEMAIKAQSKSGFPIVLNDRVLTWLNFYIGTPDGREHMRDSLARMENYRSLIERKIQKYNVPVELMAVPITESGYQNLDEIHNPTMKAAGLWQFISQTAKNYGLRVDDKKDERLDVALSTDAALRYLQSNNLRFKDWHLSVLAYNMGENAVQKGMNNLDSRDAWVLIRNGYEGDKGYLPKLMAAILIMKNPESVE